MLKWIRKYPFAGMLVALAAGILLSFYDLIPVFPTLAVCAALVVLLLLIGTFLSGRREVLWGSAALVFLFGFGVWNTTRALQKSAWYEPGDVPAVYSVQVTQTPTERAKTWQVFVRLKDGKEAVLYVQKDSLLRVPVPGDRLLVRTAISRPTPDDEYSFDYGHYLQLQGLVGSGVVFRGGLLYVGHDDLRGLMPRMRLLRDRIEGLFTGFDLRERSVLEALLLGDRRHLNADTRAAFAASGAMHVLAVSGLHVGIIAGLLVWLLTLGGRNEPLYEEKRKRIIQTIILCSVLVFYAFLTGLSPSVCRSVLMFVLLSIGQLIRPLRSRYNDIAASAFIILTVSPLALMKSGFLLSYSAVLAIIRFFPALEIRSKNRFVRGLWDLIAVSLCAQVGTLPWTIAFFHRVSNYFILTNLGVLPLVQFLLIPTFFVFLVLAPIPAVGPFIGKVLERETWALNEYVAWIQQLPGSSSEVWLNTWCIACLLGILFCFMLRGRKRWWAAGVLTVAFVVSLVLDYRAAGSETDLRTYHRGQNTTVLAREGRRVALMSNDSTYAFSVTHDYRLARHVTATTYLQAQTPE